MFMDMSNFTDFHKVKDMHFDIPKLKKGLGEVLKVRNYDSVNGIPNFAAICLNQISGDVNSTKGNKTRGIFWTKPDDSGKEVSRDIIINENLYTEFVKDFEHTYLKEVYDILSSKFKLGRVRILLKKPRTTLSWHRDPEPRLHIPIITNPGCLQVIEKVAKHLPADGSVWITNNTKYHNAFNGGEKNRVHLVACLTNYKFY